VLAVAGTSVGAALAVAVFFGLGYRGEIVGPQGVEVPPQVASSLPEAAEPSAEEPATGTPVAEQVIEESRPEASPFAAIAEPPPAPPQRTGTTTHTVAADEVLWQIADHYHLRPETVLWANDLENPDLLLIGQQLVIPPQDGVLYTVRPGDRLSDVAERYGVDLDTIVSTNQLSDANVVQAGVDIFLPGGRPIAASGSVQAVAEAPQDGGADQAAALAAPPIPLPENIDALLAAGWLRTQQGSNLYKAADRGSSVLHALPGGLRVERLEGVRGGRIMVRDPGDGKTRQAMTGWVDAVDLDVGRAPSSRELPLAYPADTAMDISHVFAPYRSQLDGAPYAEANCGPTTVGMALEAFGISVPSRQLRAEALDAQRMYGNGVGTLITALAKVVENHGLAVHDLYDGGAINKWSVDEVRAHIQQGHPVVVQVRYRSLPGRGGVYYFGDHYILVTGVVPDGFLYNDPIDIDGLGWDRVMSADRLRAAMDASDRRYAFSAFAVSR
jgi:LysM repeat protein